MDQEIQRALEELNTQLAGRYPYKIYMAEASEIDFLGKNARFMTKEQFASLSMNIKTDGALTSVPLCYKQENGRLLVLSGNHRIKASVDAGINNFLVLLIDEPKTEQQLIAIQLSHNSIDGQDDLQILKELWQKIDDLDAVIYSALPAEMMEKLKDLDCSVISEQRVLYQEISLLFLPEEIGELDTICKSIVDLVKAKVIFIGRITEYEDILNGIIEAKQRYKIINSALAFLAMARVMQEYYQGKTESFQEAMEDGVEDTVVFIIGGTRKRIKKNTAKALRKLIKNKNDEGMDLDASLLSLIKS